ncbi:glycoside hydrolase family 16 protein [Immersiella caudata]|uniref:chitinase n=1 Tax=Immersiella caudata TaxID=314043 RepID=A0AA39XDJ3_9PEZI|nr:glycoside hydrolase family 16 protein [Immersiella caudata]
MLPFTRWRAAGAAAVAMLSSVAFGQTWTACNPLHTTCPPDPALGMTINVDFTKGQVGTFVGSGGSPTYGDGGVSFTVAKSGDAPQLNSVFYIMFGRVEVTMKAAPGNGIVSSLVLQSDDLDEIDFEWLGHDSSTVQTNYFSKGQTTSYNRGQFNPAPNNQAEYITYTIDWTSERIVWYVGGTAVRTLTYSDAAGEYPQTPMQVKFGAWSGGDPANSPGTIEWAHGPTDYSKGPFTMLAKSATVSDYSTGKSYSYSDNSGTWQSIKSDGGEINGNLGKAGQVAVTATAAAATGSSPSVPAGGIGKGSTATQTGWPWEGTGSAKSNPVPDGWIITPEGKIVPSSSNAMKPPNAFLLAGPLVMAILALAGGRRP